MEVSMNRPSLDFQMRWHLQAVCNYSQQPKPLQRRVKTAKQLALLVLIGLITFPTPGMAQLAQTAPQLQPPTEATGDAGYILGAGDRIRVDFFEVPEYSSEFLVLPSGTVNLPQVGAVSIQGQTLKQASSTIGAKFAPYLRQPLVTISLLSARPIKVAIAGEVNRPGSYTTKPEASATDLGATSVTRMIELAGGITQAADVRRVQIRRAKPGSTGTAVLNVDLWQLLKTGDVNQDIALRDGDSIFIPASEGINLDEASQLASASFSTKETRPLKIAIVGQVQRPGPYVISGTTDNETGTNTITQQEIPTVTKAIQVAGGITQTADIRNIELRRRTNSGPAQVTKIDFWQLLSGGDLRQDLPLQDGDTIVIPTATAMSAKETTELAAASFSPDKITVNIVGEVVKPGAVEVPPNTPLNQAVLAAGGFNKRRAKQSAVTLIRLNPDGTVSKRVIPVDLAQGINDKNNPPLRNNDTVIIGRSSLAGLSDTVGNVLSPLSGVFGLFRLLGF
jgi:polysaccharide export outer membrane protein